MKVYKLVKPVKFLLGAILIFMAGIGVVVGVQGFAAAGAPPEMKGISLLWLGIVLWIWYVYLKSRLKLDSGMIIYWSSRASSKPRWWPPGTSFPSRARP